MRIVLESSPAQFYLANIDWYVGPGHDNNWHHAEAWKENLIVGRGRLTYAYRCGIESHLSKRGLPLQ